jgi:hypothetical protein
MFVVIDSSHEKYYIKDSKKNVYEVDMVTGGSKEKDYIIFSVNKLYWRC